MTTSKTMLKKKKENKKGSAGGDLLFVVAFMIALGIVWIITGGPQRGTTVEDPPFGFINIISNEVSFTSTIAPFQSGDDLTQARKEFESLQKKLGQTKDFGEISPYWGKVTIVENSSGPKATSIDKEYIVIDISYKNNDPINITGWKLQSMVSNNIVSIGKAVKISASGNVNIERPILASPSSKIFIATGRSPVGHSFQVNTCTGYFEQFQDFTPSINKQCPAPYDELRFSSNNPDSFGDDCLSYIKNLPRCEIQLQSIPSKFKDSCHLFITEEIHYSGCVQNHKNDNDFLKPEWRVFLKNDEEIWRKEREIIRLLDAQNKTVDVFSY